MQTIPDGFEFAIFVKTSTSFLCHLIKLEQLDLY